MRKFKIRNMDGLPAFEAAAPHGSFTHVAKKLFLTKSAVSRQIATLESILGVWFFARAKRRVVLTRGGGIYVTQMRARWKTSTAARCRSSLNVAAIWNWRCIHVHTQGQIRPDVQRRTCALICAYAIPRFPNGQDTERSDLSADFVGNVGIDKISCALRGIAKSAASRSFQANCRATRHLHRRPSLNYFLGRLPMIDHNP